MAKKKTTQTFILIDYTSMSENYLVMRVILYCHLIDIGIQEL